MKNSEYLNQLMSRLGQLKSTRVREDLLGEVNSAIQSLERKPFIPWFLRKTATLSVNAGDGFVALPSDFSLERENTRPYYVLEGEVVYMTKRIAGAVVGYVTTKTSPQVYGIVGETFEFRPLADQSYDIVLQYYARTNGGIVDDNAEITNAWLLNAKDWVGYRALKITALTHLQNDVKAAHFQGLETAEKFDLYKYHEAREHQNQDYEVGGVSDGS